MLEFTVSNQELQRTDSNVVASDSANYLEADFTFSTDWAGFAKTAKFKKSGETAQEILLVADAIPASSGLNLTQGSWLVSVVGVLDTQRITTNSITIDVVDALIEDGDPFETYSPTLAEQALSELAGKVDQDDLSDDNPLMDGTASPGTSTDVSRKDHKHPSDTTKPNYTSGTWTPTITAGSGTITSYTLDQAVYRIIGDLVFISLIITITDAGTGAVACIATLPFPASGDHVLQGRENASGGKELQGIVSEDKVTIFDYDNGNPIATGAEIVVSGFYVKTT